MSVEKFIAIGTSFIILSGFNDHFGQQADQLFLTHPVGLRIGIIQCFRDPLVTSMQKQ